MTADLAADLRRDEGLRLKAYPDPLSALGRAMALPASRRSHGWESLPGHPWTVGYGHTGLDVGPGTVWTLEKAEATLAKDIEALVAQLDKKLPWWRKLDPVRRDVVANMAFNLGVAGLLTFKNTLARLKAGDYPAAAVGMAASLWAAQVEDRAKRLVAMMRTGSR